MLHKLSLYLIIWGLTLCFGHFIILYNIWMTHPEENAFFFWYFNYLGYLGIALSKVKCKGLRTCILCKYEEPAVPAMLCHIFVF